MLKTTSTLNLQHVCVDLLQMLVWAWRGRQSVNYEVCTQPEMFDCSRFQTETEMLPPEFIPADVLQLLVFLINHRCRFNPGLNRVNAGCTLFSSSLQTFRRFHFVLLWRRLNDEFVSSPRARRRGHLNGFVSRNVVADEIKHISQLSSRRITVEDGWLCLLTQSPNRLPDDLHCVFLPRVQLPREDKKPAVVTKPFIVQRECLLLTYMNVCFTSSCRWQETLN